MSRNEYYKMLYRLIERVRVCQTHNRINCVYDDERIYLMCVYRVRYTTRRRRFIQLYIIVYESNRQGSVFTILRMREIRMKSSFNEMRMTETVLPQIED